MGTEAITISLFLTSWVFVSGGLWKLFERVEKVTSEDVKKATSDWLLLGDPEVRFGNWAKLFRNAFESVFGVHWNSSRFIWRSAIASGISVLFVILIWMSFNLDDAISVYESDDLYLIGLVLFFGFFCFNLVPDVLSLLESRYVLKLLSQANTNLKTVILLLVDAAATTVFAVSGWLFLIFILGNNSGMLDDISYFPHISDGAFRHFRGVNIFIAAHPLSVL